MQHEVLCPYCGKVLALVTLPSDRSPADVEISLSAYICADPDCPRNKPAQPEQQKEPA